MLHKQAQIHSHPPPTPPPLISYNNPGVERGGRRGVQAKRRDTVKERERQNKRGGERKRSNQAKPGTGQEKAIVVHVPPLSSEEKLQVNIKVEKQRYIDHLNNREKFISVTANLCCIAIFHCPIAVTLYCMLQK